MIRLIALLSLIMILEPSRAQTSSVPVNTRQSIQRSQLGLAIAAGQLSGGGQDFTLVSPGLRWRHGLSPKWGVQAKGAAAIDLGENAFVGSELAASLQYAFSGIFLGEVVEFESFGQKRGELTSPARSKFYADLGFKTFILSGTARAYTAQGISVGAGTQQVFFRSIWDITASYSMLTAGSSSLAQFELGLAMILPF